MTPASSSRRAFLALAASGALAGCNELSNPLSKETKSPKLDAEALVKMTNRDAPDVPPPNPVAVERSYVEAGVARAEERLATVPDPLGPDDVPNEAIRERLAEIRTEAGDALEALGGADPSVTVLHDLRRARENAEFAATAWAAIETDLVFRDVARRVPEIRSDLDSFRERWRYVGDGPIRALFVHDALESLVEIADNGARRDANRRYRDRDNCLAVGELAGALEEARAAVDDATYIYDRFDASLDSSRDLRPVFGRTSRSLAARLRKRRRHLPTTDEDGEATFVERDISGPAGEEALRELSRGVRYSSVARARKSGRYARAVLGAYSDLVRYRAFRSLRKRVSGGEDFAIETAEDVTALRASAVEAITNAPSRARYVRLAREEVTGLARTVSYTDEQLEQYDDPIRADWVLDEAARYLVAAELARAVPPVSDTVGAELRAG